jgi:signal peptidase I
MYFVPSILIIHVLFNFFLYFSQTNRILPYSAFAVVSESMLPTLKVNDLIVTSRSDNYQVGDIVVFTSPANKSKFITHRIASISDNSIQTKGDNNPSIDGWTINKGDIIGKTTIIINNLGSIVTLTQSTTGSILFLIIPSVILVFVELQAYWKRITLFVEKRIKEP